MKNEKKFYEALENIFVGAPIEGEGGYVNLLKIKEKYYRQVVDNLKLEIKKDVIVTESFKEDFYNLLYNFFEKYFSECGSVYFTKTANWQKVYEKVYTDNKDVVLFWKTNMLYYVKSDILFRSIFIKSLDTTDNQNYVFFFDVGDLKQKQNNEKKELVFSYKETKTGKINDIHDDTTGDTTFVLNVAYSERGRKTDIGAISSSSGVKGEIIEKAINAFKKQTTVDFFINKNARAFLEEQLDIFLHQLLLDENSEFVQERLNQLKAVKVYAKKLISFIAQFEEELVKIWNKPKFVRNSNYVITIDRLPSQIISKIKNDNGLNEQIAEWIKLGIVNDGFSLSKTELDENPHLPIDTKYFKSLELEILGLFDNLDRALDGRLIKSENYQALNTLKARYKKSIKNIYIDPPFNTGNDFEYLDEYQDSSWLSIMNDRLCRAHELLSDSGSIFLHLDHFAEHRGRELLDHIFNKENFINNLAWSYRSGGASDKKSLPYKHDSILFYSKDKESFHLNSITERQYMEKSFMGCKRDEDGRFYSDTLLRDVFEGEIFDPKKSIKFNVRKVLNLSREFYSFKNSQKPEGLLHLLQSLSTDGCDDIVMDFFAGSGPTLAVAKKMSRKFIGVDMGEHFETFYMSELLYNNTPANRNDIYKKFDVIELKEDGKKLRATVNKVGLLGRMKEVLACSGRHEPCGVTESLNWQGGGFFKYYSLEQYEDVLDNAVYTDKGELYSDDICGQYVFFADEKLSEILEVKGNEVTVDFSKLYDDIDLPESISMLYGKAIEKITADTVKLKDVSEPIKYNTNAMTNEEKIAFVKILKPLIWWGKE
ncbi:MAG: site-specific DNA-methyltransferase [Clostridia bacterium]|nr:site-specific DNA-methyltransferase [Clostridia bacterium]